MIKRQGSIYHFRRLVPERLRAVVGRREIWCSLRTANRSEARARAARLFIMTEDIFDPDTCVDPARWELEIAKLSAEVANLELVKFKKRTEIDDIHRLIREDKEVKAQAALIEAANEKLRAIDGKMRAVRDGALTKDAALKEARSAHDAVLAALTGFASGKAAEPAPKPSPLFSALIEDFITEKQRPSDGHRGYSPQTTSQTRVTFGLWLDLIGDGPVREFKGQDAGRFREFLLRLPASHGKSRSNIIEPLDAIERADRSEQPIKRLTMKTAKRHFSTMSQYWKWLAPLEHVDKNIFAGFTFPGTRRSQKKKRDDWSAADLKLLFESDWYTSRSPDSAERWLPLIGLYSGMRLEEIARLRPAQDIEEILGIWCFRVQEHTEPEPWSPKSEDSVRVVPIHSRLLELGLLDLVDRRRTHPYLWPDLEPSGRDRKRGSGFSREFSRRKQALNIGEKTAFHSFRHTARTLADAARVQERWIDAAFGHSGGHSGHDGTIRLSQGRNVYTKRSDVECLREVIEAIKIKIEV